MNHAGVLRECFAVCLNSRVWRIVGGKVAGCGGGEKMFRWAMDRGPESRQ